jgi:hypothetical protein
MEWPEAIEVVISRTKHTRFRWLCSEENPDAQARLGYRRQMVEMATGTRLPPEPEVFPDITAHLVEAFQMQAQPRRGGCCGGGAVAP